MRSSESSMHIEEKYFTSNKKLFMSDAIDYSPQRIALSFDAIDVDCDSNAFTSVCIGHVSHCKKITSESNAFLSHAMEVSLDAKRLRLLRIGDSLEAFEHSSRAFARFSVSKRRSSYVIADALERIRDSRPSSRLLSFEGEPVNGGVGVKHERVPVDVLDEDGGVQPRVAASVAFEHLEVVRDEAVERLPDA
jgi:hypothetical protein